MTTEFRDDNLKKQEGKGLADPNIVASTSHNGQIIVFKSVPKQSTPSPTEIEKIRREFPKRSALAKRLVDEIRRGTGGGFSDLWKFVMRKA